MHTFSTTNVTKTFLYQLCWLCNSRDFYWNIPLIFGAFRGCVNLNLNCCGNRKGAEGCDGWLVQGAEQPVDRQRLSTMWKIIIVFILFSIIAKFPVLAFHCYLDTTGSPPPKEGEPLLLDNFKVFDCNLMKSKDAKVRFFQIVQGQLFPHRVLQHLN